MTKSFSRYVYTTFYTINQICCVAERKIAPQTLAEPLSSITKNNTSIITSLPYLYEHSATIYERHNLSFGAERICKQQKIQCEWIQVGWKRLEESPLVQLQVLGKKEKSSAICSNMAVNVQSTTWTILVSNLFNRSPIKSYCITMRCLILSNCRHAPRQSLFI